MINLFDYIFYRVYKAYKKRDDTPAIYASAVLSVMQFFSLLSILAIIRLLIDFPIPQKYFILPIILILIGINWFRYERGFDVKKLEEKWCEEDSSQRKLRGWLLVVSLIFLILFPILIGVLKHNLGVI
ncbi:MAG: hypothetical protein JNL53_11365 [Cyclobacteriaceae bacterium]|nr:hypothetical protein [Cyclobacteriaceae bacterium]